MTLSLLTNVSMCVFMYSMILAEIKRRQEEDRRKKANKKSKVNDTAPSNMSTIDALNALTQAAPSSSSTTKKAASSSASSAPNSLIDPDAIVEKRNLLFELFIKSGVAKVDPVIEHLDTFLNDAYSGKLILFAHHKRVLDGLAAHLQERGVGFIRIDGGTESKERFVRYGCAV